MHSATESLRLLTICETAPKNFRPLSRVEALTLSQALLSDGECVAQTVFASLADAVLSISNKRFTWATVKLYYTLFYALKSLTMLDGISVFYKGTSPFSIKAHRGELFRKRRGNSHSITFDQFSSNFKSDVLLSQPIGVSAPLEWMVNLRNIASYKTAPFPDPEAPNHFVSLHERLRVNVSTYFAEETPVYAFQEEHAILAYPILALRRLNEELLRLGKTVQVDHHYVRIFSNAGCDVAALRSLEAFPSR